MAERGYSIVLYLAVGTAMIATYGVYRLVEGSKGGEAIATRPVVVAARDLPEGAAIDRLALSVGEWPSSMVPEGAFASFDSLIGRVTRVSVFAGEAIVPGRLAPAGASPGLEVKIGAGKRAMAIKINDVAGISGLIQPNSRVDVLVTLKEDASGSRQVAKLFMENMRVLSVGTKVQRGDDGKAIDATSATLEVRPDEAERLAVAMNQGSIQLVLRGYGDPDPVITTGARSGDILAQLRLAPVVTEQPRKPAPQPRRRAARAETAAPPAAPPPVQLARKPDSLTVQIYRAGKVSQQKFEKSDSADASGTP